MPAKRTHLYVITMVFPDYALAMCKVAVNENERTFTFPKRHDGFGYSARLSKAEALGRYMGGRTEEEAARKFLARTEERISAAKATLEQAEDDRLFVVEFLRKTEED